MEGLNLSPLATVFIFTAINEAVVEYIFGNVTTLKPYLPLFCLGTGMFLAFAYHINFFSLILGIESSIPFVDTFLSGFVISRGSNFLNDFAQKFLGSK